MGPPGRHYGGLQTRPQGVRAGRPPLGGDELRALRRLQREQEPKSPFVFTSERGAPFTTAGFARMVERAGPKPSLGSRPTRTCSGTLAATRWPIEATNTRALQAYLGYRNIQHTVRYSEMSPTRFKDFWRR
jgi:hypothetical protein